MKPHSLNLDSSISPDEEHGTLYVREEVDKRIRDLVGLLQRCVAKSPAGETLPKGQLRTSIVAVLTERYSALTTESERTKRRAKKDHDKQSLVFNDGIHDPEA